MNKNLTLEIKLEDIFNDSFTLSDFICLEQISKIRDHVDKNNNYHQTEKPKVYILGPMTGYEDHNFKEFFNAEKILTDLGFLVLNPARNVIGLSPKDYMQIDIQLVFAANVVFRLKGWSKSKGAKIENAIAEFMGLELLGAEE